VAIKLIRLFTGADGQSHFEVGKIKWDLVEAVNAVSKSESVHNISFEETKAGASLEWHNAPHRQYVITLSGRLEFETRSGARQVIKAGDVLLAEDTSGGGHRWWLLDDQPWRRVYVTLHN
jgi:uncharacterized cupin superfamily protein